MSADTVVSTADDAYDDLPLRVGFRTSDLSDERLRYVGQLGVEDVFVDALRGASDDPPGLVLDEERPPSAQALVQARNRVEDMGIRFAGIQTLGEPFYEPIAFGEDGADERIEYFETLLRNAGRARIPVVGYRWSRVHRTSSTRRVRGDAKATAYDHDDFADASRDDRSITDEEFWRNYVRFLEAVVPVAEEAGVTLAIHPADPPTFDRLEGLPRLFRNADDFERAMEAVPSANHGLKLCLGCFSEMGEDVEAVVERFGERDQIAFVHFRDVVGTVPSFHETFVDEGNYDEYAVMKRLHDVGFSGVLIPDHVPRMEGDDRWSPRGRGYTAGYLKGLLAAVRREAGG